MPEASAAGLLAPLDDRRHRQPRTSDANLAGPGTVDGKTYGVPIGANTLGLYYNKEVLKKAGVDPPTITDWASLTAALEKVTKAGKKGITFSGDRHRGGQLPVPAVVLGRGREPDRARLGAGRAGRAAVADWVAKGYAPNSVINDTQTTRWHEFATGEVRLRRERLLVRQGRRRGEVPDQDHADPVGIRRRRSGARPAASS